MRGSNRHMLGSISCRPSAEKIAEILRAHPAGLPLAELVPLACVSRRMTTASAEDAIAAGLVVRCGGGARNFRYAAAEHAAAVQAAIDAARAESVARKCARDRMRLRRRGANVARGYVPVDESLQIRRVIVPAGSVPPPECRAPRSVWELAA